MPLSGWQALEANIYEACTPMCLEVVYACAFQRVTCPWSRSGFRQQALRNVRRRCIDFQHFAA